MVFRRTPKFADDCRRFSKKPEDVSNIYHIYLRVQSPESRVQSPESRVQSPGSRVQSSPESSPGFRLCLDKSVSVENRPLVKFIQTYIRGSSGVFSISSLVRISMTSFPVLTVGCAKILLSNI